MPERRLNGDGYMTTQAGWSRSARTTIARRAAGGLCAVALLAAAAGCGAGAADEQSGADGPIKVGGILSLSGGGSVFGEAERRAMELAVKTVNARGGVDGRQLELVLKDDKSQPSEALTVARQLITGDKVSAIFGASSGSSTLAVLPVATSGKVPVLAPNSTVSVTGEFPDYAFRTTPVDTAIVSATLEYLKKNGLTSAALLTESAAFGAQAGDAIEEAAGEYGVKIVAREQYDPSATDLKPELTKIRGRDPKIIIVWGTGPAPSIAFKNMRELRMDETPRLAPLGVATESNIKLADGAMDGVLIPGVIDSQQPENEAQQTFVDEYQKSFGNVPTTLDAIAWDPAFLFVEAAKQAGSTEPAEIQKALDGICDFEGAVGSYCYQKSHDGLGPDAVVFVKIEGTKFVSAGAQ
jgi:branched-chain amino acid transport system substrate-binding protein